MSWDLMILPFDPAWADAGAIPSGWKPGSLAPRATVVAAVASIFPGADEDADGTFHLREDWTEIWIGKKTRRSR